MFVGGSADGDCGEVRSKRWCDKEGNVQFGDFCTKVFLFSFDFILIHPNTQACAINKTGTHVSTNTKNNETKIFLCTTTVIVAALPSIHKPSCTQHPKPVNSHVSALPLHVKCKPHHQTIPSNMTNPSSPQPAPPQPPLPTDVDTPPVVHGIDQHLSDHSDHSDSEPMQPSSPIPESAIPVRPGDLAAFAGLFHRFHSRVEKSSAGRKYRPLRDAFEAAANQIAKYSDRIDLQQVAGLVVEALREGCESRKIAVVDACLDCIHRLFEYGHVGSAGQATQVALDTQPGVLDSLIAMVCGCLEVKDEDVYLRMVQTLLTAATRTKSGLHQRTLLAAVRTIYNIFLNARVPGTRTTARVSLTQILNIVFSRMESETAEDVSSVAFEAPEEALKDVPVDIPQPAPPEEDGGDTSDAANVLQKDAYLLFRALCKLSAKEEVDTTGPEPVGIRSKLLSLELLRNLISNSGPAFRSGERFIYALRQYLAPSLLINCMWNTEEIMDVSFDIFEMLLRKDTLRPLLKTEIAALFDTVVFRFLESPTAGPMRKRRVITLFNRLSTDRQTMADLFLNYDCDMESPKIFERIVNVISAAAQDKTNTAIGGSLPGTGQVDTRVMSLTSVIQIVRSLREWSKPIEDSKGQATAGYSDSPKGSQEERTEKRTEDVSSPVSNGDEKTNGSSDDVGSSDSSGPRLAPSPSGTIIGMVSEGSDRDTTKFEEALRAKHVMKEGIKLFNTKPKRGIEYLINKGRLQHDPVAVAEFLRKGEDLDAALVGEYLGVGDAFNINTMHAYTDMMDFAGITFDGALRIHLGSFRLPGEAQKIERIMEKFASRYCECNPDTFANADAAFVLAFSTIMLHTDAHNNTIKHKMSKEDFIRNNRGINDGSDLDPTFLSGLYERITTTEIRLAGSKKDSSAGDGQALNGAVAAMDPTQRARQFEQESKELMDATKILFTKKRRPAQDYTYYSATNVYHARLMFETAYFPVLAAISLNLEDSSPADTYVVALCLDGFRNGIAVASTFGMSTAKDAFVSSLAKFTHLNSISEMRPKNVECVRMVLAIAALEGNNLGEQWIVIVRAISQLEQIRAVASGNPGKYLLQKSPVTGIGVQVSEVFSRESSSSTSSGVTPTQAKETDGSSPSQSANSSFRRTSSVSRTLSPEKVKANSGLHRIDPKTATMATTIAESEIERIFTNSSGLPAGDVADFCGALCTVALAELNEKPAPRIFCLQKIVEMAYYNMESRTRIQWGKIWSQMSPFFGEAMCHVNRDVAMYATDALRQLASKFLEKDELSNFSFQKAFMKPFEVCFGKSKNVEVRELVLTCISQIVLARAGNIKSGWKAVFAVLALAADDKVESIMNFGWQIVDSIARKYIGVLDDVFNDSVSGISAYTRAALSTPVSLAAIELLSSRCAKSLADGAALSVLRAQVESKGETQKGLAVEEQIWFTAESDAHIGAWFPILTGLASAIQDERAAVRMAASEGLYKVLSNHGGRFSPSLWALIFRGVLSPVFDDVTHLSASTDRTESAAIGEWATTTGSASLKSLVDVFAKHLSVTRGMLEDLLELIRGWILQENEVVAREGMSILARLITVSGDALEPENWKLVVQAINAAFIDTMPHEILGPGGAIEVEERTGATSDSNVAANGMDINGVEVEENGLGRTDSRNSDTDDALPNGRSFEEGQTKSQRSKIDYRVVRAKCVVQLLLINLVQEVAVTFYKILSTECVLVMSKSLEMSYSFAHDFNTNVELRYSLWRSGFMNQVPNLIQQETNGLIAHLRIMFWLYLDPSRDQADGNTEASMMNMCEKVLRDYITACDKAQSKAEEPREVVALSPVVSFIVNGMMQMSHTQFERHLPSMFNILLDLVDGANDRSVRRTVTRLIRSRVSPVMKTDASHAIIGKPQLPGFLRDCIVKVKLSSNHGAQTGQEVCTALNKVGGVRAVNETDRPDSFRVTCLTPDEMLVSGVTRLPFVRTAFVDAPLEDTLD